MKIAIFTDLYAPWGDGGIVSSVKAQKTALEELGHEVTIFCPGFQAKEKNVLTVPSHKRLRINGAVIAKRPEKIIEAIREQVPDFEKFDLIHVHYEASCSIAGVKLAEEFNIPLVQTMHGREDRAIEINVPHPFRFLVACVLNHCHKKYLPHRIKVKRDKFQAPTFTRVKMWELMVNQAECADVVITPSKHFARKLEHYDVTKPIVAVSNGIDEELVKADFTARELQEGDVLKMIWNSRVSAEKRMLPFLKALVMLKRPYILYVYGGGNELKKAERFAEKHNLRVKFYGPQKRTKIIQRMEKVHLGIMASYNFDTQGMTLLEAEATGLPVFFCDPEMIEVVPEESYILAGGPSAEAMAISLENFPAEKINAMSKKMLKHRQEVLEKRQVKNLLKVYELAIGKKRTEDCDAGALMI